MEKIEKLLAVTDEMVGIYTEWECVQARVLVRYDRMIVRIYGDGTPANPGMGDPELVHMLGAEARNARKTANTHHVPSLLLSGLSAQLSKYVQTNFGTRGANGVASIDMVCALRIANGCPDPSFSGGGAGSSYQYLLHPGFASLQQAITSGAHKLPADVVAAPRSLALATIDIAEKRLVDSNRLPSENAPYAPGLSLHLAYNGDLIEHPAGTISVAGSAPDGSEYTWVSDDTGALICADKPGARLSCVLGVTSIEGFVDRQTVDIVSLDARVID